MTGCVSTVLSASRIGHNSLASQKLPQGWRWLLLVAVLSSLPKAAWAETETFTAKCVGVNDGDTITVLRDKHEVKIRLEGIDCPELGQDFGTRAKQFTSDLVFGTTVRVEVDGEDKYGRMLAHVTTPDDRDVAVALVGAGMAWHYKKYSSDPVLAKLEEGARESKRGLWSQPRPIPPWQFRHGEATEVDPIGGQAPPHSLPGPFHGNTSSHVYHALGCPYYNCKNCTVSLASEKEAQRQGFHPHVDCVSGHEEKHHPQGTRIVPLSRPTRNCLKGSPARITAIREAECTTLLLASITTARTARSS